MGHGMVMKWRHWIHVPVVMVHTALQLFCRHHSVIRLHQIMVRHWDVAKGVEVLAAAVTKIVQHGPVKCSFSSVSSVIRWASVIYGDSHTCVSRTVAVSSLHFCCNRFIDAQSIILMSARSPIHIDFRSLIITFVISPSLFTPNRMLPKLRSMVDIQRKSC